ncbi:MAG: 4-hydroxybenzoate octaprenyltransferase [Moraxellaceae bacterium]|nr:4-hydroxybenzoate octaprenyltransferase [Moraxellaceae bacterium]
MSYSLKQRLPLYAEVMRLHRPIGIYLLLWPTLWAVWIAAQGKPSPKIVIIFMLGVVFMRSAGCVINDWADRNFDGHVARTKDRPIASGRLPAREALYLFVFLVACSAALLPFLNLQTFFWSFGALALASLYPFMKRFIYLPQLVLGAAFSWAIPMAFVAQNQSPNLLCWLLYAANLIWTVAYDTQYAMADREDDVKIGVKSTAILFGRFDLVIISLLQGLFILLLALIGYLQHFGFIWAITLGICGGLFIWQYGHCNDRQAQHCTESFLHNHKVGMVIFLGLVLSLLFKI